MIRYIICSGDLVDGFFFIGPFDTRQEAIEWAEAEDVSYVLGELHPPGNHD